MHKISMYKQNKIFQKINISIILVTTHNVHTTTILYVL